MIALIEQTGGKEVNLSSIEAQTAKYAEARKELAEQVAELEVEIEALKRKRIKWIKALVARAADHHAALQQMIEAAPHLFDKPKTQTFAGIKVGFRKGKGGIDWEDDAAVCERIRKLFPKAQADLLIKVTEKPIAKALEDLDVADLKRLGCTVEATGDVVFIKPTDTAVDKIVNALLKEATDATD